ncbi:MAG: hypothetical protein J3Q66DRAFT_406795 [Benniella sp.]|nr:MAG: hypothetical protein J3Q66DRAFT_406795 [Benniella sp.]
MATNLPELRQHIAQYFDFDTLKAFSLVCKAWYHDARPLLWKHFSCKISRECSSSPEEYALWLDTIRRNANSFRHICYNYSHFKPVASEICNLLLDQCHGLVTIGGNVTMTDAQDPSPYWKATLMPLIKQNRVSLQRLQLRVATGLSNRSLKLRTLVANLPCLRSLELGALEMTLEDLLLILDACPDSLECLELLSYLGRRKNLDQGDSVSQLHHSSTSMAMCLRLKHLRIRDGCDDGILEDLLSRLAAHSLEELQLDAVFPLPTIPILQNALWRLTHLHLSYMFPSADLILPALLDAIHPHQLRSVHLSDMDTECTAKLIEKQHQSLSSLNVTFEQGHTGALGDILATCGKLKRLSFSADPFVDVRILIDPQKPWVCTELETFEGHFGLFTSSIPQQHPLSVVSPLLALPLGPPSCFYSLFKENDEHERKTEDLFMRRLGQLTKLRFVHRQCDKRSMNTMKWSLASGLNHLNGLANLQTLKYDEILPKGIGIHEMMFIKQHWHSLQEVVCHALNSTTEEWLVTNWPRLKVTMTPMK